MEKYPKPVSKSCTKIIYEQMNSCFCTIDIKNGNDESGCFINIKHGEKIYPVLMTKINILEHIHNNTIDILINNKPKILELGNIKYADKENNICLLEIKENKKDNIQYIDIDENIFKPELEMNYYENYIYIIQYKNKADISVSYGIINAIFKKEIRYSSNIDSNSKLSIIFNLNNNKIIGININKSKYYYKGIFFTHIIDNFYTSIIYQKKGINDYLYKIDMKDGNYELAFFIHVNNGETIYQVLMTNMNVLEHIHNKTIDILIDNEPKMVELGNIKYADKENNICLVEILQNKNDNIQYIEIGDNFKSELDTNYFKESIYIIQYNNKDISVSYGIINEIFNQEIRYSSNIDVNSKISIIFNLNNNKIIGISGNKSKYNYKGLLINYIIKKCFSENKIIITFDVYEYDIGKKLYFLNEGIFKELNKYNTELYINDKKEKFEKYFKPDKIGKYLIKLKFNTYLKYCSYMFARCCFFYKY